MQKNNPQRISRRGKIFYVIEMLEVKLKAALKAVEQLSRLRLKKFCLIAAFQC